MRLDSYKQIMVGGTPIKKVYYGTVLVWGKEQRLIPLITSNNQGFGVDNNTKALAASDDLNEYSETGLTGASLLTRQQYDDILTYDSNSLYIVQERDGDVNAYLGEIKLGGES